MTADLTASQLDTAQPTSVPALLLRQARMRGRAVALRKKELGRWKQYTWADYAHRVESVALGLLELGLGAGEVVAIQSDNRPAWVFVDVGAQSVGASVAAVFPTSPAAELADLLKTSGAVVLVAEDEEQIDKAWAVRDQLPALRRIVVIDPRGVRTLDDPMLLTLSDLEGLGRRRKESNGGRDEWVERAALVDPSSAALVVCTSQTSVPPQATTVSHADLLGAAAIFAGAAGGGAIRPDDEALSYLPLCHIAEHLASIVDALRTGYVVNFGEGGEAVQTDLRDVQPTLFLGPAGVWQAMMATVQSRSADATPLKRSTYRFWMAQGERLAAKRMSGRLGPLDRAVAGCGWLLLHRSLRDKLGLGRIRVAVAGVTALSPEVLTFFWAMGVPLREGYGQTEGVAVASCAVTGDLVMRGTSG